MNFIVMWWMMVKSPCVNQCKLDSDGVCVGCLRTIKEIKDWRHYSDRKKIEVHHRILATLKSKIDLLHN